MTRLDHAARSILEYVAGGELGPAVAKRARARLEAEADRAARAAVAKERHRTVRLAKSLPRRKAEKVEDVAAARRTGEIRVAVFARTEDRCSVPGCGLACAEMHHALSGGRRKPHEAVETCLGVCAGHHDLAHGADLTTMRGLAAYCVVAGLVEAARALAKRIAKVEEARAPRAAGGAR